MTTHWSHSQLTLWQGCGKRYELERIKRYPTPPAWYNLGGKAVHRATEWYDKHGSTDPLLALAQEVAVALQEWPEQEEWLAAGYGREKQRQRHWETKVVDHVQRWVDFRQENPQLKVIAIEEEVSAGTGQHEIKAYLDRMFLDDETGEHLLVDIKSSSKRPESSQQLGIYRALWNLKYPDRPVHKGHFFMTKDGGFSPKDGDLSMWGVDILDKLGDIWGRAKSGRVYLPVMSSGCETCSVKAACYVKSGDTYTTRKYDDLNPNFLGEAAA